MSAPEIPPIVETWLRYAREDLQAAEGMLDERELVAPRHVCFHAQQAAEKGLKATLIARQISFDPTHDLERLAGLLGPGDAAAMPSAELASLTRWAVRARYPGEDDAEWPDAEEAVRTARAIVLAAEADARRAP